MIDMVLIRLDKHGRLWGMHNSVSQIYFIHGQIYLSYTKGVWEGFSLSSLTTRNAMTRFQSIGSLRRFSSADPGAVHGSSSAFGLEFDDHREFGPGERC